MSEKVNDKNENIKLSIAIPTYNGAKYIREALDSIIAQLDDIDEEPEIVISDNASTDETPEVIREYQKKYPFIKYFRNEKNMGLDRNLDLIFKRAKGEYVWLLSDDDTLKEKSIPIFLDKLNKYKNPSVLFLNYSECDVNMNERLQRHRPDIHKDVYCEDGDIFIRESKFLFGLVSSLVIKRQEWNQANIDKYIGCDSVHIAAIIEIVKNQPSVIISDKLVNLRTGNLRWGSEGTFLYPGFKIVKIFQGMKNMGYEKGTYDYLIGHMYKANLKAVLVANSQGLKNKKNVVINMIECYKNYPLFWLIHLPLLIIPNIFYKIVYKACKMKLFNNLCKKLIDKIS